MHIKVILVCCLCLTVAVRSCDYREGIQPVPIINSQYTLVNGEFCCPLHSECMRTEREMECLCPHGLVDDPCRHCKTCGKTLGEECGGRFGIRGECVDEYVCSAKSKEFLDGANITGICVHKSKSACMPCM